MAAHPLLVAALLFGGGTLAGNAYAQAQQKKRETDAARARALGQAVVDLEKGKPYAVMLQVDPTSPQWGNVRDPGTARTIIQTTMQGLGWGMSAAGVQPRTPDDIQSVQAGRPSQWVFTAVWQGSGKTMPPAPLTPTWVGMALVTPLPSAA
jgi:hypothetical protein